MAKKQKKRAAGEPAGLTKKEKVNVINTVGTVFMFVILALVLYATMFRGAQRPSARLTEQQDKKQATAATAAQAATNPAAPPVQRAPCPSRGGEAWEYDAPTDCYYDPSPGHAHWHQGAAPPVSERAARMAGPAPTPIPIGAPTPLPVQPPQP